VTDEQRSRPPIFIVMVWAGANWLSTTSWALAKSKAGMFSVAAAPLKTVLAIFSAEFLAWSGANQG
jgi:hypothetical protein